MWVYKYYYAKGLFEIKKEDKNLIFSSTNKKNNRILKKTLS